ncbi:MAG TPA: RNA polymerase sigma-70 factor [Spirillospora sp.]|nr:RNA polymerase sigma-70 factor [Spirillospora sp.]
MTDDFETYRPLMFSIAYRMLGSAMEAEDIVQEAYLRYQRVSPQDIDSPKAFLSAVVTRLCLNQLQSARARREQYVGPWLPEPILTAPSPAAKLSADESISMAFLVLLENLTPPQRAVFLLREVFDYDYAEIAAILGKDEAACRQLFSRAKKHLAEHRPRFKPSPEAHRQMLERFMNAVGAGDMDGLTRLLADNVTMWADGGGKARGAATRPLVGVEAVAQFVIASTRLPQVSLTAEISEVNGEPAAILRAGDQAMVVLMIAIQDDRIHELRIIGNPDKLRGL